MTKILLLIRHAKTKDAEKGQKDLERSLTEEGLRDASIMGRFLYGESLTPDKLICSTAVRTKETAELLAEQLKYDTGKISYEPDIYEGSVRSLLSLTNNFQRQWNTVALIGHNPSITYLAEYLTHADIGDMAPCGVAKVSYEGEWNEFSQGACQLDFYEYPESIRQKL